MAAGQAPWEITARLLATAPDLQALLTVNCGQGPAAAALRAPIVPLGQSGRDDQGWRLQARLHQPGVYQIVVQSEKNGFAAPFELAVTGQPAPTATPGPPVQRLYLPALTRTVSTG